MNRRRLPKPAASAMSVIGRLVSSISRFAKCSRRVCATAFGDAPTCCTNSRCRWRGPMPTRAASSSTDAASSTPSSISLQRALDDGGRAEPGRRAGRRLGTTAQTRAEPGFGCRRSGRVVADVDALGARHRAHGPAVDARGRDGDEELPVEPRIAARARAIERGGIEAEDRAHGSASDACPKTYFQPAGVRTYVSLNHSLRSDTVPAVVPLIQSSAVTTAVSPHTRTFCSISS